MSQTNPIELEKDLRMAELKGDVAYLGRVLSPDFVAIGPRGFVLTKEAWLDRHRSGDLKYESIEEDEVSVRTYGDVVVMTGREMIRAAYKGREVPVGTVRTTRIFVRRGDDWRLAGVQMSPIMGAP